MAPLAFLTTLGEASGAGLGVTVMVSMVWSYGRGFAEERKPTCCEEVAVTRRQAGEVCCEEEGKASADSLVDIHSLTATVISNWGRRRAGEASDAPCMLG